MYATGDRARHLPDGRLEFIGRLDQQIKLRGHRIELGEIEEVLKGAPGVTAAVALVHDDGAGGRLVAYVTPDLEQAATEDIRRFLATRLPSYMLPGAIVTLPVFPLLPNGKLDRGALRDLDTAGSIGTALVYAPPRTDTEHAMALIWQELLKVDQVGQPILLSPRGPLAAGNQGYFAHPAGHRHRADIYVGMNALQYHASTRTKDDIEKISHVYLDLDHGGTASLEGLENSDLVPRPNYVLNTSPGKFQVVWKVEGMTIEEAESLNRAMVREFDGDPAATDSTRVLRLPGFANKKYQPDFFVQARAESTQTYHLRDFKLQIDSQDAPRHHHEGVGRKESASSGALSQSEHDWAFALRALSRGDDPEEVIRRIADYRAADKHDPEYYARFTVQKTQAEIQSRSAGANDAGGQPTQEIEISRDPIEMP